ncbi:hypothetical protein M7I_1783 [Glarea lozoyensis 74030]|uniref:Uncharacterized protein n=1 Tax=Glarea lozoyensis (strain ATCC 74030 / MF5533) TaxID=1104152 RepID=H0EH48_GLAL7|nr:hypothetical protein M7I_1783 [Glarea lozoyensis 74030]
MKYKEHDDGGPTRPPQSSRVSENRHLTFKVTQEGIPHGKFPRQLTRQEVPWLILEYGNKTSRNSRVYSGWLKLSVVV